MTISELIKALSEYEKSKNIIIRIGDGVYYNIVAEEIHQFNDHVALLIHDGQIEIEDVL